MHSITPLGLACLLMAGGNVFADDLPQPMSESSAIRVSSPWQTGDESLANDRLRYLGGRSCLEQFGCSAAARYADEAPRPFIQALDIGSYGPMDVKFTGNRVKLKVRF